MCVFFCAADELLRMSVEQQSELIAKPELFRGKVREIEQVFRRYTHTHTQLPTCNVVLP